MSYDAHIERADGIGLEEWLELAESQSDLRVDGLTAFWGEREFTWYDSEQVSTQRPDAATIGRMLELAEALGAELRNDDGLVCRLDLESGGLAWVAADDREPELAPATWPKRFKVVKIRAYYRASEDADEGQLEIPYGAWRSFVDRHDLENAQPAEIGEIVAGELLNERLQFAYSFGEIAVEDVAAAEAQELARWAVQLVGPVEGLERLPKWRCAVIDHTERFLLCDNHDGWLRTSSFRRVQTVWGQQRRREEEARRASWTEPPDPADSYGHGPWWKRLLGM